MDPAHYLEATYYEHWLAAFEGLLINHGHITRKELDDRVAQLKKESH
jgi:nitrile hydratase